MKLRKNRLFVLLSNALSLGYVITTIFLAFIIPNTVITLGKLITFSLFFLSAILSTRLLNNYEEHDRMIKTFKNIKKEK